MGQSRLMYQVQILLPLYDNDKQPFSRSDFELVREELTEKFGGVTAFVRSPAKGLWKEEEGQVSIDDVVKFEVLAESISHDWWAQYRSVLEQRFKQTEVLVLATKIEKL